jgi:DNA-binding response OmpR family regulator
MENLKVLIIDDDPMTCNLLEMILQMENYQTVSANYIGQEGITALLDDNEPDLLILDLNLGSQDSLAHVVTIRAHDAWQNLPILMTSGIDRHRECLKAGANEFMLKPFNWEEMTRCVNRMRDGFICQEV